jgi:hypothetical protein
MKKKSEPEGGGREEEGHLKFRKKYIQFTLINRNICIINIGFANLLVLLLYANKELLLNDLVPLDFVPSCKTTWEEFFFTNKETNIGQSRLSTSNCSLLCRWVGAGGVAVGPS